MNFALSAFDKSGKEVSSQIIGKKGNTLKIIFRATVPSVGAVYDVRKSPSAKEQLPLKVTANMLEMWAQ